MKITDTNDLVWFIDETLEREEVSAEQIDQWLGENARNKNIPNYVWDIINAVYHSAE